MTKSADTEMDDRPFVDEVAELAYEQATGALDQQAGVLSEVRARTSTLVAVTALVATFLGKEALSANAPEVPAGILSALALLSLAAGIFCCIRVLTPTTEVRAGAAERETTEPESPDHGDIPEAVGLSFSLNVERLLTDAEERGRVDYDSLRLSAARTLGACWAANKAIVDGKLDWFDRGCWALLTQTISWILLLGWGEVIT